MCDSKELKISCQRQALLPGVPEPPLPPSRSPEFRRSSALKASAASAAARRERLSRKQRVFAEAYLQSMNGLTAARKAGYSHPESNWPRILASPAVQDFLDERMAERRAWWPHMETRIIEELSRIAFADPRELMRWGPGGVELAESSTLSPEAAAGVSEVSEGRGGVIRLKKHDKVKALELLGRHFGLFAERVQAEISGPGGSPLCEDKRILVQFIAPEHKPE